MDIANTNWQAFAKSGAVNDYLNYRKSIAQNEHMQGVSQNAHQDGRNSNQGTEYR